ncbi:MAG: HDOD domain-containing protein [Acidimicrobiia bacterium]
MIDLDELARAAAQLEPLAPSVTRLAALVCAGAPELGQVVEIVRYDEALTASLLRSANSSWSSSRVEITTVRDAVIRLGASPVLAMTLGRNVRSRLDDAVPEYGLGEGELWRHSVAASLAAELLAPRAQHRPPPEAATAALLHDVGKLVMARYLAPPVLEALRAHEERGLTAIDAEAAVLGIDHAELGAWIAQAWSLPDSLVRAIGEHARPGADADTVVYAVYLADVVALSVGAGTDGTSFAEGPDVETFARAMGEIGLTAAAFDELRLLVEQRLSEVERRFDEQPSVCGEGRDHPV